MRVRMWSLLVWALVGASAVFWALKMVARPQALPQQTTWAGTPDLVQGDLARLVGTDAAAPSATTTMGGGPAIDGRLVLVGVVSLPALGPTGSEPAAADPAIPNPAPAGVPGRDGNVAVVAPGEGLALISIDGKPARAYAVGDVVDGDRVLQRVSPRAAEVGPPGQPAQLSLVLPRPPEPAQRGLASSGASPAATVGAVGKGMPRP